MDWRHWGPKILNEWEALRFNNMEVLWWIIKIEVQHILCIFALYFELLWLYFLYCRIEYFQSISLKSVQNKLKSVKIPGFYPFRAPIGACIDETVCRSEGFPDGIFHPCTLWHGGLVRWKLFWRVVIIVVAIGVIWKFRSTFRPGNYYDSCLRPQTVERSNTCEGLWKQP